MVIKTTMLGLGRFWTKVQLSTVRLDKLISLDVCYVTL